jgi:hypothetical protein
MRQKEILIDPIPVDADGLAQAQAVAGAGELSLNGVLIEDGTFTADYARRLGILSAGNDAGITFTILGTDPDNKVLSEAVTGSAGAPGTSESTGYFKTVISVTASGAAAGNVSVGTVDEFSTNTIPLNTYNSDPATVSLEDMVGTFDVSVEETFSKVQYDDSIKFYAGPAALTNTTIADTASSVADLDNHASGVRLIASSYSSGAELKMVINQNRCN